MRFRLLLLCVLAIFATGAGKKPAQKPSPKPKATPKPFEFATRLGAVHVDRNDPERLCFDLPSGLALAIGTKVTVVSLSAPQEIAEAAVHGLCPMDQLNDVMLDGRPVAPQEIRWTKPPASRFPFGVGILGTPRIAIVDGLATVDLDGDGATETFTDCPSEEGSHLTVWSGLPRKGTRRWHGYLYQGWDLETACLDSETKK